MGTMSFIVPEDSLLHRFYNPVVWKVLTNAFVASEKPRSMVCSMIFVVLLLAIIQGIGEFLPISSSGHLLLSEKLLCGGDGLSESQALSLGIFLHAGTLLAILVVFARDIGNILFYKRRWILYLMAGTLPGALGGLVVKYHLPTLTQSLPITSIGFLATAFLLYFVFGRKTKINSNKNTPSSQSSPIEGQNTHLNDDLTLSQAILIGFFQTLAILPGFSRSCFTISGGILSGLNQRTSALFSFLLAIPIIGGALLLELIELLDIQANCQSEEQRQEILSFLALSGVGAFISFLVGLISLRLFLKWLRGNSLQYWAIWLVLAACIAAIL